MLIYIIKFIIQLFYEFNPELSLSDSFIGCSFIRDFIGFRTLPSTTHPDRYGPGDRYGTKTVV